MSLSHNLLPNQPTNPSETKNLILSKIQTLGINKETEVKNLIAEAIEQAINDSKNREFPDYIPFVLKSPEFKIIVFQKQMMQAIAREKILLQPFFSAKYLPEKNLLGFMMPSNEQEYEHLIKSTIPDGFWTAYQTILKFPSPITTLAGKPTLDLIKANTPFSTPLERRELHNALEKGEERIVGEFKLLRDKVNKEEKLNQSETEKLSLYNAAVKDYQPKRYGISLSVTEDEKPQLLSDLKSRETGVGIGVKMDPLHFDICTETDTGFYFSGYLTPDFKDKGLCLIKDTTYRMNNLVPNVVHVMPLNDADLIYITTADAELAANPAKLNQVFYPERNAYHTKQQQKYRQNFPLNNASSSTLFGKSAEAVKEVKKAVISLLNEITQSILPANLAWSYNHEKRCAWLETSSENLKHIHEGLKQNGIGNGKIANKKAGGQLLLLSNVDLTKLEKVANAIKQPAAEFKHSPP